MLQRRNMGVGVAHPSGWWFGSSGFIQARDKIPNSVPSYFLLIWVDFPCGHVVRPQTGLQRHP